MIAIDCRSRNAARPDPRDREEEERYGSLFGSLLEGGVTIAANYRFSQMSSANSTSSQACRDEITKALLQKLQQMLETKVRSTVGYGRGHDGECGRLR